MSAQPHDWASHLDHVPELDDPHAFRIRRPRISFFLFRKQRSAAHNAWSALDQVKHGTITGPIPAQPSAQNMQLSFRRVPRRFVGHGAVLALVLVVIVTGGLPDLALDMDWTQGATVATDHVAVVSSDLEIGMDAPIVIAAATNPVTSRADTAQDSLAPSLLPRPVVVGSAFIGTHKVAAGEKLGQIAAQYNVSVMAIVAANNIDPRLLAIGQELRIPRVSGLPHKVADGETVESIAAAYNIPTSAIRFFPPNNLGNGRSLVVGDEIYVPGATAIGSGPSEAEVAEVTATAVGMVLDNETRIRSGPSTEYEKVAKLSANAQVALVGRHDNWFKIKTPNGTDGWISADLLGVADGIADQVPQVTEIPALPVKPAEQVAEAEPESKPAPVANRWVWPTAGDITSGFGYRNFSVGRFHNGLDIANRKNTPIRAARGGRVIAAGWCSGYGYCVMINHGDGTVSEYGHMAAQPFVVEGAYVNAGDRIGLMGSTYDRSGGGFSTGVHLHFTIKVNGKAVNPMRYLP